MSPVDQLNPMQRYLVHEFVEDYEDGSPAHAAGLNRNDVIVAVDGTPIESVGQLQRMIALHQPGETVALSTIRYGESRAVRVRLAEAPGAFRSWLADGAPSDDAEKRG